MALFGLHSPIFGPLHPIIGKLSSSSLSDFTQWYIPFGAADGSLTENAGLKWDTTYGLQLGSGSIIVSAGDLHLKDNTSSIYFGNSPTSLAYWYLQGAGDTLNLKKNYVGAGATFNIGTLISLDVASGDIDTCHNITATGTVGASVFKSNNYRNADETKSIIYNSGSSRWYVSYNLGVSGNLEASGTLTLPAMSVAGFVKNDVNGLLSGGNTISSADITDIATTYLKLDCSNDPITDALHFTSDTEYIDQESW